MVLISCMNFKRSGSFLSVLSLLSALPFRPMFVCILLAFIIHVAGTWMSFVFLLLKVRDPRHQLLNQKSKLSDFYCLIDLF